MCGTEGWKNRLKYSSSPRCNRIDILCWLSLNTPDNLWKLSRTGWLSSGASPEMGWEGILRPAQLHRWNGEMGREQQRVALGLRPLPCIWQQLLCLGGLKLLQRMLQAQPFPAQPHPPPLSSVPCSACPPGLCIPPDTAPSVLLVLPTVNAGGTELSKL